MTLIDHCMKMSPNYIEDLVDLTSYTLYVSLPLILKNVFILNPISEMFFLSLITFNSVKGNQ